MLRLRHARLTVLWVRHACLTVLRLRRARLTVLRLRHARVTVLRLRHARLIMLWLLQKEEEKRRERVEDWERHQKGQGYRSKHRTVCILKDVHFALVA